MLRRKCSGVLLLLAAGLLLLGEQRFCSAVEFTGTVVDASTRKQLPARVYVKSAAGEWLFVESASKQGSAWPYREQWVPMPDSVELHTTISAHPFTVDLPAGEYEVTIERGKEYHPLTRTISIGKTPVHAEFAIQRWINLAERGWYSGETHVHRRIPELPNVMLAEDLNVAFPVTYWTINAFEAPSTAPSPLRRQGPSPFGPRDDRGADMLVVDKTHVLFPRNTEYEIFSIRGKRHVLGAVFLLNHRTVFQEGMPPVAQIAERAHQEGALLDLDKHSWPWSMMLVPIAKVDLFELANNSVWRTNFGFRRATLPPAEFMTVESDDGGMTEWGWLDFGFQNYYALLNCGFRLQPTAGTASGVHPVPLGFGRVYVHLPDGFNAQDWLAGLKAGQSFVSTGPMLLATVNDQPPGHVFRTQTADATTYHVTGEAVNAGRLDRIEIIVNGRIVETLVPENKPTQAGAFSSTISATVNVEETSWIAVRAVEKKPGNRVYFAHTAPFHIEVQDQPIRPYRNEINFLISRVADEIERNRELLPEPALREFQQALEIYRQIAKRARDK